MVTMNATMKGAVNSLPLCDLKILGRQSGYFVFPSVSQKPKATNTRNQQPMVQ